MTRTVHGVKIDLDLLAKDINGERNEETEKEWKKWCDALYFNYDWEILLKEVNGKRLVKALDEDFKATIYELAESKERACSLIYDCLN